MEKVRKGRQEPTVWCTQPYKVSDADTAVMYYEETGRTAQEWQRNLLNDILASNDDGLWTHTKYGYAVPRRNGKNEIVAIRELYALEQGEKALHTAHLTTTSSSAAQRLANLLDERGYEEVVRKSKDEVYDKHYSYRKQLGLEVITILRDGGGSVSFRTRTSKGGLGEGYDLLVIDEAQEFTDDQNSSLKYVVTDSKNPQTLFCGTPPTAVSSGTVFKQFREDVLGGRVENAGWAEWSVTEKSDVRNKDLWYECNPSLGTVFTERSVSDEVGSDELDFNIQRLGLWISYNLASAITEDEWNKSGINDRPNVQGGLYVGIKYGGNGENVALTVACKSKDGKIFIQLYDLKSRYIGDDWIINFIKKTPAIQKIAVDGRVGTDTLVNRFREERINKPTLLSGNDFIVACASFERAIKSESLLHMPQPALDVVVTNCEKKMYSKNGFVFNSIAEDLDICTMDSAIIAHWLCQESKEKKVQKIAY